MVANIFYFKILCGDCSQSVQNGHWYLVESVAEMCDYAHNLCLSKKTEEAHCSLWVTD